MVRRRQTAIGARAPAAAAALALPAAAEADWRIYGHDLANSRDAGGEGPTATELPTLQRAWMFKSPTGDFTGTPVVVDGVLVAGDNGGWVYALDAVSGRRRSVPSAPTPAGAGAVTETSTIMAVVGANLSAL